MKKTFQTSQTTQTPGTLRSALPLGSSKNLEHGTKAPSSLLPPPSTEKRSFSFPDSVQSDLFGYLKPHQQAVLKPYLRLIKRPYQEKLCISLMDYLEGHDLEPLNEPVLRQLQAHIIVACDLHPLAISQGSGYRDEGLGKNSLRSALPLGSSKNLHQPKTIGTLIKQLFGSFNSHPSTLNREGSLNPPLGSAACNKQEP